MFIFHFIIDVQTDARLSVFFIVILFCFYVIFKVKLKKTKHM